MLVSAYLNKVDHVCYINIHKESVSGSIYRHIWVNMAIITDAIIILRKGCLSRSPPTRRTGDAYFEK